MMIILTLILHISFPDEHSSSPREEPLSMRGPRTFAGQKEAPVIEFAMSFAESIGNSEETRDKCELVCGYLKDGMPNNGSPGVADLGGLAKLKRVAFARILEHAGVDAAWLGTWEDLLDITFEPPTEFVAEGKENVCSSKRKRGGERHCKWEFAPAAKTGRSMKEEGTLDRLVLTYEDFPQISVKNPSTETLSTPDVEYVNDVMHLKWVLNSNNPKIDATARKHLGAQARLLFPHLPTYGKTEGDARSFTEMLKHRFANPRKTRNIDAVSLAKASPRPQARHSPPPAHWPRCA